MKEDVEMVNPSAIVKRVIQEVAGTIATNGIQELNKDGEMSSFNYVRSCLIGTAYNAVRSMDYFDMSYNEFFRRVEAQVALDLTTKG